MKHKFKIGTKVIYTNDFGVCWGIKIISGLDERCGRLTYHYEGSDTPWYSVTEKNFKKATFWDLRHKNDLSYFQQKYGFTPTIEQLGGCY